MLVVFYFTTLFIVYLLVLPKGAFRSWKLVLAVSLKSHSTSLTFTEIQFDTSGVLPRLLTYLQMDVLKSAWCCQPVEQRNRKARWPVQSKLNEPSVCTITRNSLLLLESISKNVCASNTTSYNCACGWPSEITKVYLHKSARQWIQHSPPILPRRRGKIHQNWCSRTLPIVQLDHQQLT